MKRRTITLLCAATILATALGSCRGNKAAGNADPSATDSTLSHSATATAAEATDTLLTDSVGIATGGEGTKTSISITIDYPVSGPQYVAVRQYIASQLIQPETFSFNGVELKKPTLNTDDAQQMVAAAEKYNRQLLHKLWENDEMPENIGFEYEISILKTAETARYITYTTNIYTYSGGAHGSTTSESVNISKRNGKPLTAVIDTTQAKALQPLLRKGLVSYFHECGETAVNEQNLADELFLDNNFIPLPANTPTLTPRGVLFSYRQYEIGPYALGMPGFIIPYPDIRPYLTREALELIE